MKEPEPKTLEAFNLSGPVQQIGSGNSIAFRVGNVVLKRVRKDCQAYSNEVAEWFNAMKETSFRVSKPLPTKNGKWMTEERWTACTYIEGHHDYEQHIDVSIKAIKDFHEELSHIQKPQFLDGDSSPYNRADRYAWEEKPLQLHPEWRADIESLYKLRQPIKGLNDQLIHGDLNPQNILLSDTEKPAIIDMAPYWRPPGFALAVYAYWIGPWKGDQRILKKFLEEKEFKQLLLRAGLRMLLILSEVNSVSDLDRYRAATKIVREFVQ